MTIGIPKEIKTDEYRVGAIPQNVKLLVEYKHSVFVQSGAGEGSGFSDEEYIKAGAVIVDDIASVYKNAQLIVKVKEPQEAEYELLNESHTLFCYLHLAPLKKLTTVLMDKKVCAIAYETLGVLNELPLLKPMSEIAGKMSAVIGAYHLSRYQGGNGTLISGADGVKAAKVLVIGAGNAGFNAVKIAVGLGADVSVINRSMPKLQIIKEEFPSVNVKLLSDETLQESLKESDIVIASVLIHGGAKAPKLITRSLLKKMKKGSVIVDITIDQGGISEASRPTTHTNPTFIEDGVLHYCVANMPGAYPKSSTLALSNATFKYVKELANNGILYSLKNNEEVRSGVNVLNGSVTNEAVALTHGLQYKKLDY